MILTFNLITLRKAKIVYNFGLSECNRVKKLEVKMSGFVHTVQPKIMVSPENQEQANKSQW